MKYRRTKPGHRQTGATLIEVLVSIVILSIGLLGTAGLLINSMRAVSEQGNAVGASLYARELAERMMGNPNISRLPSGNPYLFDSSTTAWPTASLNCNTNSCSELDRASWDMKEWTDRIRNAGSTGRNGIPGLKVKVCLDSLTANSGTATQWNCSPGTNPMVVVKMAWATRDSTGTVDTSLVPRAVIVVTPGARG